jgi:hypothetical protein
MFGVDKFSIENPYKNLTTGTLLAWIKATKSAIGFAPVPETRL